MHRLYQARKQKRMILHQLYLTSSQKGLVCESEASSEGGLASSQGGEGGSIEGLASSQGLNPTDSGSEGSCDEGLARPVIVTDSGRIVIFQEEKVESSSNLTLEELMSELSEDDHDLCKNRLSQCLLQFQNTPKRLSQVEPQLGPSWAPVGPNFGMLLGGLPPDRTAVDISRQ